MILIASRHPGFAERHQHRSVGTELADDVPRLHAGFGRGCHRVLRGSVRRPHIAVAVDMHPVWPDEHPGAKTFDHVAFRIELVDRVVRLELAVRIHAIETEPAASCGGHPAPLVASDKGPDTFSLDVNPHPSPRGPFPPPPEISPLPPLHPLAPP